MRALQLESFGRLVVVELPEPVAGDGEIVVETIATGICGSDIHGYTGDNGRRSPGQVMGHETVGRIHSLGAGVDPVRYPVGAVVTVNPVVLPPDDMKRFAGREQHSPDRSIIGVNPAIISAFAERFVAPSENVVILGENMPVEHGALIEPLAVGLNAARRVAVEHGDRVLVVGGGPIGQSSILAAFHEGAAEVYVSEPNDDRRALCERLGAVPLQPGSGALADQLAERHGGLVDVAIDAVGLSETVAESLSATVYGGRVCLVGMNSPDVEIPAYRISTEERSLVGSFTYTYEIFADCARWVAAGDSAFSILISEQIGMEDADAMFRRLAERGDVAGKVLVRFDA